MPETQITANKEEQRFYPFSGVFNLTRRSFWTAGQDSFTQPPAQNPDMFQQIINAEPVLNGIIQRRRGYTLLSSQNPRSPYRLGYSFRSELLGLRSVVFTSTTNVLAITEQGSTYLNPIFVPSAGAQPPRMVLSRSYGYFADGVAADNKKWNGTLPATALSNWGIALNSGNFGPNTATVAADQGNPGGGGGQATDSAGTYTDTGSGATGGGTAWGTTSTSATTQVHATGSLSNFVNITNFGFSIPGTATILGIAVSITRSAGHANLIQDNSVKILQGGSVTGTEHAAAGTWPTSATAQVYGNSGDLWGAVWSPTNINASNFGVTLQITINAPGTLTGATASNVSITVYYSNSALSSWTNPGNITTCSSAVATASCTTTATSDLRGTGFGFAASGQVTGIQVTLKADTSNTGIPININPVLVKAGVASGLRKIMQTTSTSLTTLTFGGQFDLWGGSWLSTDVNAANFGVQFNCTTASGTATVSVNCVQITIFTAAGPLTVGAPGGGNITLLSGRTYFYAFENSATGHVSTISPASATTGPLTNNNVPLTLIPTSTDTQVDTVLILATADGNDQTTLYLVGTVPNGTSTFTDNVPDPTLLTNALYQYTDAFGNLHGIANNNPPPAILFPTKHKGRIYGAVGSTLYFSKNLDDVTTANGLITSKWEEAWPATYQLDISEFAETIKGLLSDGETLWIATERAIRRLIGDSPNNFQKPEIQFNETGILNQDVWKITFYEGQPVGTMWITPDNRVMSSDFNTYLDVGQPIQDVLNSINKGATNPAQASFVSKGPADYFMLYIPTGSNTSPDTVCVYNMRAKKWFIWKPTDLITASAFFIDVSGNPRWVFAVQTGPIYEWTSATYQDRIGNTPTTFPVTLVTSWLDFGDATLRKALNQLLYLGSDTALTLEVDGAIIDTDLDTTAQAVLPTTPVAVGPLLDLFVPLAGTPSFHRWYQFTFLSPASTAVDILDGFSVEASPLFRY